VGKMYVVPELETVDLLEQVKAEHHQHLNDANVTIGLRMVQDTQFPMIPMMLHQGYPAAAIVRITPLEKRAFGMPDATITVDYAVWIKLSDESRAALIDHELEHLGVVYEKDSIKPKLDSRGRPKLRIQLHDIVVGGFRAIIARHGRHALEATHVRSINNALRQQSFTWSLEEGDPYKEATDAVIAGTVRAAERLVDSIAKIDGVEGFSITTPDGQTFDATEQIQASRRARSGKADRVAASHAP
jgi:hypothetical protein